MRWPTLSTGSWKVLLSCAALCAAALLAAEVSYAPRTLAPDAGGTLGITYHEMSRWGRSRFEIDEIAPASPLLTAGAARGDRWMPDRTYDAYRHLGAHERIGLTLFHDGVARHITVETIPDAKPRAAAQYILAWIFALCALALGLLIGLRQPNGLCYRGLSLGLVAAATFKTIPTYTILPAGTLYQLLDVLWGPFYVLVFASYYIFFFNFPDDRPRNTATKRWLLRYGVPIQVALMVALLAVTTTRVLGFHAPYFSTVLIAFSIPSFMFYAIMWTNWRNSEGNLRERHLWVFLAFCAFGSLPIVNALLRLAGGSLSPYWWFPRAVTFLYLLTFGYAILRHRVISVGFAINRAVVFGAASIGMVIAFALLEWVAHDLLEASGHEKNVYIDAAIALAIILSFHRLRHWGEKWIERLFFHAWHAREAALRKFVQEAPYFTRTDSLLGAFANALTKFTDGAGHALYRRTPSGGYRLTTASLSSAPETIDADDPLVVSLRAHRTVTHCSDAGTSIPGEIALPNIHHGQLDGFVLLDKKPQGEGYRPDELEVLGFAAHQVGLDFRALRMENLEHENEQLERENQMLHVRIDAMAAEQLTHR